MKQTDDSKRAAPKTFDYDEMLEWFLTEDAATWDNFDKAVTRLGRNYAPALLFDLHNEGLLYRQSDLAPMIDLAWGLAEWPEQTATQAEWIELFKEAGYAIDGVAAPRPLEPTRLFRGAPDDHKRRMAWTSDISMARKFASGEQMGRPAGGKIWTVLVPPTHLLAQLNNRNESEYVIDPRGLTIELHE
jgi:hypothetical protein